MTTTVTPLREFHVRGMIDCDIHPVAKAPIDVTNFLPQRWQEHRAKYRGLSYGPLYEALPYTRLTPNASRHDAIPPGGGAQGSDLEFMRQQHLDPHGFAYGILQPLSPNGPNERNLDYAAAVCSAVNTWQEQHWVIPEPRLRGSIMIPQEDPSAAVAEIERCAPGRRFAQVSMAPRTIEPHGRRKYWPIYAAAERANLPIGIHVYATGPHAFTPSGWPSYYIEEHYLPVHTMQAIATSMIMEGVFERFPKLKLVLIEGGFAWAPALGWRLDHVWSKMRDEVPHLKRPPSEVLRQHVFFTTQPIEEPNRPEDLRQIIDWIGWEKILFSTDYPHWDFDDPRYAFKFAMTDSEKNMIFRDNAARLYGLEVSQPVADSRIRVKG